MSEEGTLCNIVEICAIHPIWSTSNWMNRTYFPSTLSLLLPLFADGPLSCIYGFLIVSPLFYPSKEWHVAISCWNLVSYYRVFPNHINNIKDFHLDSSWSNWCNLSMIEEIVEQLLFFAFRLRCHEVQITFYQNWHICIKLLQFKFVLESYGRGLNGELYAQKITEVNLSEFVYRLFHEVFWRVERNLHETVCK